MYSTSGQSFDGFITPMGDLASDKGEQVVDALEMSLEAAHREIQATSDPRQKPETAAQIASAFDAAWRILAKARLHKR